MEWLWILQLAINMMVVFAMLVWWKERSVPNPTIARAQEWEAQVQQWEKDAAVLRRKTEDQLRFLVQLCEQAHTILMRNGGDTATAPASAEEEELKSLRNASLPNAVQRSIPSVQELEVRKQAVRAEIPMDLRSLLRDQLT